MADVAVDFLLVNLKQVLLDHAKLIGEAKDKVEELDKNLRLFQAFLRGSTKKRIQDNSLGVLVRQIRDVVYEAEDIIDTFVTQANESKSKPCLLRVFQTPVKLITIAKEVERISKKVRNIYDDKGRMDFASLGVGDGEPDELEVPTLRQENIVGFDDEALKVLGYLTEKTQQLDVISIIGMAGQGKTTLAGKIFHDPVVIKEFSTRIWVYISQGFTKKDVFLTILREFTRLSEDMHEKTDQELAQLVINYLEKCKFLIVMDDVWSSKDWDKLQIALPKSNKMGKVLITSRNEDVARHANLRRDPHKLCSLNHSESWLLLQYEVFGNFDQCPSDLEVPGKLIAQRCDGLPLALVVIGGILVKKASALTEMVAKKRAWVKVSKSVGSYIDQDPEERMKKFISLSYYKLPFHLRACFLYFGMFPEDFEVPVWKLITMWIAEGFIQQKNNEISLEETAESYLEDLISRNLVRVDKTKSDGKVKTCRIHDMLRDFCKDEGGDERDNFFQEMKNKEGVFQPPVGKIETYRRLCIHSNVSNFFGLKPHGPHVRSFVCYSKEDVNLQKDICSVIPKAFKLLRVLDVKPVKLTKIPVGLYHLIHLRFIILSFNLGTLPEAFSKLWNVQTLIIDTTSRTLDIKADIWKLSQLRYLKTNVSATLAKASKSSKEAEKLHTLGRISPQNCTEEVFERARSLKKLGIRGRLSLLLEGKTGSFDSLGRLSYLEKLKLLNDVYPRSRSEGPLRCLPPVYKFPLKLRSLTLAGTFLEWSHMSVLELLPNLEVLKLKDEAFMGTSWEASIGGFRNLEVLKILHTNLVVWKASEHHFPKLRQLELHNCEALQEVPVDFAGIECLQLLIVHNSKFAAASVKRLSEARQRKIDEEPTIKFSELKLSIFPLEE